MFYGDVFPGVSKLVVSGRIGEAIEVTRALYPGLLERDLDLLFLLKYRQFVEMVNGSDSEVHPTYHHIYGFGEVTILLVLL